MSTDVAALKRAIVRLTKECDALRSDLAAERDGKAIGEIIVMRRARDPWRATDGGEASMCVVVRRAEIMSDDGSTLLHMLGVLGKSVAHHFGLSLSGKVLQL